MTAWFFGNMLWAGVTMLIVLAVRRPAAQLFGAGPAYALWLLPALRLILPPMPAIVPDAAQWLAPAVLVVPVAEAAAPAGGGSALPLLLVVCGAGSAAFMLWQWLLYRRFLTRLSLSSRSIGLHRGLPLIESGAVEGPVAVGLLDRRIVVPLDFAVRYSAEEQRLALDHERIHHRRGDIWWNLAALLILALNWFNPIAWISFRAYRADQELACDAAVAARAQRGERHDYACAMIKSASRNGLIAACPLNHSDQLKRRLKMMNTHRKNALRTAGGAAALLVLGGVSIALGSPGIAHPHPEGEGKERRQVIIMERHGGEHHGGEEGAEAPRVRSFTLHRGEDGEVVLPEGCSEGEQLANVDESSGNDRTRILLCHRGGEVAPADRAERLQRARDRLAEEDHLSGEHRDRVLQALDREIARLRGQ
jgi:bla regulator protein blaR1